MSDFIWQTANLGGFISGCYTNDLDMIRASLEDFVIEKQRVRNFIPGFDAVRKGAIANGRWVARSRRGTVELRGVARLRCAQSTRCDGFADSGRREKRCRIVDRAHQSTGAHVI